MSDLVYIKKTYISIFPVKEENFASCGSTKVFSSKFSPLMTKCSCIPPLMWGRLEYCSSPGFIFVALTGRVTKSCGCSLFVLSLAVGGIATCVCIHVTEAASINHKQFQENILKTYYFLGDLLHLHHRTSDPAAYRIWLSAIRVDCLNVVTT